MINLSNIKSVFNFCLYTFLIVFIVLNLILGFWGVSSIMLTTIIYGFILFSGIFIIDKALKNPEATANYTLLFTSLIVSFFIGELVLRYVFKVNLQKQEIDGGFFYSIPYGGQQVNYLARKYILGMSDETLINRPAYSQELVGSEFKYIHKYNAIGLRGMDYSNVSNCKAIVALGDSYTEGVGTPVDSTWPSLMEQKLNKNITTTYYVQNKIKVLNGGLSGSDPIAEYFILTKLLLKYNPRVVIVAINSTDITDIIRLGGFERYSHSVKGPWWGYIYQFSFIARAAIYIAHPMNWLLLNRAENIKAEKKGIEILKKCITEEYFKLSKENEFKLIIVLHPTQNELEENTFSLTELDRKLRAYPEINVINLFDEYKKVHDSLGILYPSLYWPIDGHHNSTGYKLWADILAKKL
jgi:lysophospholipase L1-like esterase